MRQKHHINKTATDMIMMIVGMDKEDWDLLLYQIAEEYMQSHHVKLPYHEPAFRGWWKLQAHEVNASILDNLVKIEAGGYQLRVCFPVAHYPEIMEKQMLLTQLNPAILELGTKKVRK